jgi:hypothetical protein
MRVLGKLADFDLDILEIAAVKLAQSKNVMKFKPAPSEGSTMSTGSSQYPTGGLARLIMSRSPDLGIT